MTCHAGIDVSLETSSICVVDAAGAIVCEIRAPSEPEALAAALLGTGLPFARVGLEAGPLSQWLHAGRAAAGRPVLLLETRRPRGDPVHAGQDRPGRRAGRRTGGARGVVPAVHVKSALSREARALLTVRELLVGKLRDLDNGVRGLLRGFGLKVGRAGERAFPIRARELVEGRPGLKAAIKPLLRAREALLAERERLHRLVPAAVRDEPVCRRLMTVPGVGPATALSFGSAADNPGRFSRSRGIGGHISKQGDGLARRALHEAANVPLTRTGRWSALKAWGVAVAERAGMRRAKVAVARKLAVVLHRIWRDGTEFRWSREAAAA
jgi:transposase